MKTHYFDWFENKISERVEDKAASCQGRRGQGGTENGLRKYFVSLLLYDIFKSNLLLNF